MSNKFSTRFFSKKQEQSVANTINGKPVPNSGARPYAKGDVKSTDWLIECKTSTTHRQSFAIKKDWLNVIKEEAFQAGKPNYALAFSFGPNQENYYILTEKKFKELFDYEGND